jgi:hypothetical protein
MRQSLSSRRRDGSAGAVSERELAALERAAVPETGAELLRRMVVARDALDEVVSALTEDELADYRDGAGWSTVDHLSHIAVWERMFVAQVTDGTDYKVAGLPREKFLAMSADELNNALYHRVRGMALGEAMEECESAHAAVVVKVWDLPEEAFARPYWHDDPQLRTVMEKASGDTYRHYLEHRRWITELIENQTGARSG